MFTGIVEELGEVVSLELAPDGADARLRVNGPAVTQDARRGDSIAVSGICLTVVEAHDGTFAADVMAETLARTSMKSWTAGTAVNLERSLTPTSRLGGHIVQGHVDGVGTVLSRLGRPGYDELRISVPAGLAPFVAAKGAVAVDGVSLTVISVLDTESGAEFALGIIPETRDVTTLGRAPAGGAVNIEVDVLAKYTQRLLAARHAPRPSAAEGPAAKLFTGAPDRHDDATMLAGDPA